MRIALVQQPASATVVAFAELALARRRRLATALLAAVVIAACSGIASETHVFQNLADAKAAGAIAKGWLPDALPPGSYDIREAHVPNGRGRWGVVNFPPAEADVLRALLHPDERDLTGHDCDAPGRIEWWPIILRGNIDGARLQTAGLRTYAARAGDLVFAVNWAQGRAYYCAAR